LGNAEEIRPAPAAVFSSTLTVLLPEFATARSGLPSG